MVSTTIGIELLHLLDHSLPPDILGCWQIFRNSPLFKRLSLVFALVLQWGELSLCVFTYPPFVAVSWNCIEHLAGTSGHSFQDGVMVTSPRLDGYWKSFSSYNAS